MTPDKGKEQEDNLKRQDVLRPFNSWWPTNVWSPRETTRVMSWWLFDVLLMEHITTSYPSIHFKHIWCSPLFKMFRFEWLTVTWWIINSCLFHMKGPQLQIVLYRLIFFDFFFNGLFRWVLFAVMIINPFNHVNLCKCSPIAVCQMQLSYLLIFFKSWSGYYCLT